MKKINNLFIALFAILSVHTIHAQERGFTYTNLLHPFLYNPSLAGNSEQITAVLNMRGVSGSVDGTSRNYNLGVHMQAGENSGIGLKIISHSVGAFQTTNVEGAYSRLVKWNANHSLRLGLSAGIMQTHLRTDFFTPMVDLSDPALNTPDLNNLIFTCGAGAFYSYKDKFEAALSFPSLISGSRPINNVFIANLAYALPAGPHWKIKPILNHYGFQQHVTLTDVLVQTTFDKTIQFTTGYRSNGTMPIIAGIMYHAWSVQYAYYQTFGAISGWSPAQHEIALMFGFKKPSKSNTYSEAAVGDEVDKLTERMNALVKIEQTNPGMVDMKHEMAKLSKELNTVLSKYKITSKEQLDKVRNLQQTIESFMARYHE